jgi:hypothetical protein
MTKDMSNKSRNTFLPKTETLRDTASSQTACKIVVGRILKVAIVTKCLPKENDFDIHDRGKLRKTGGHSRQWRVCNVKSEEANAKRGAEAPVSRVRLWPTSSVGARAGPQSRVDLPKIRKTKVMTGKCARREAASSRYGWPMLTKNGCAHSFISIGPPYTCTLCQLRQSHPSSLQKEIKCIRKSLARKGHSLCVQE